MLSQDNLISKSVSGISWDFSGKLANHFVRFGISVLLARLLTPEDFGLLGMVSVFIAISQTLSDAGLGAAVIQKQDVSKETIATAYSTSIVMGLVLSILLAASSGLIANFYGYPELKSLTLVLAFSFFLGSATNIQIAVLQKHYMFKKIALYNVYTGIVSGVIAVILALYGAGYWSLVAQNLLRQMLFLALVWRACPWKASFRFKISELRGLMNFGSKLYAANIINAIYDRIDVVVIGKLFTASILGIYYRAVSFQALIIQYTAASIISVVFPLFSDIQNDKERVSRVFRKALGIISISTFGLVGLIYCSADSIIVLLFTEKWFESAHYLRIILLSSFAYPVSVIMVNVIGAMGNSKAFLKAEVLKKLMVSISIPIGFSYGIDGYLYSLVVTGTMSVLLNMYYVQKQEVASVWWQAKILLVNLTISVLSVFVVIFVSGYMFEGLISSLISNSIIFVFLFIGAHRLVGSESSRESIALYYSYVKPAILQRIQF